MPMKTSFQTVLLTTLLLSQVSFAAPKLKSEAGFIRTFIQNITKRFTPEEVAFDASRRKFMRSTGGAAAGAAIMASGGGGVVAGIINEARKKLPLGLKQQLAKLRMGSSKVIHMDMAGLEQYKLALQRGLEASSSEFTKLAIKERLDQIRWALGNRDDLKALNKFDDKRLHPDKIFDDPAQRKRFERRIQKVRDKLLKNGQIQGLEIQVLTARTLLDNMLLKKIAYQIKFVKPEKGEYAVVLNEDETRTLRKYSALINSLEKSQTKFFRENDFLTQWLPVLKHEVDLALEMYEVSRVSFAGSCKSLL